MYYRFLVLILFSILLVNCVSREKVVYLNDIDSLEQTSNTTYSTIIKTNDILNISVSSSNMESVQDFNKSTGSANNISGNTSLSSQPVGYLVDGSGNINFPVLGTLSVAGLKKSDLELLLQDKLSVYSKDALVDVRILNFKITILGEVNAPGTYPITDERITILQAIGLAGDLTLNGQRGNVLLLREVNGTQESFRVDLTTTALLDSPVYYLQQNDVVYIEPSKNQINSTAVGADTRLYLSLASFLLTLVLLFVR